MSRRCASCALSVPSIQLRCFNGLITMSSGRSKSAIAFGVMPPPLWYFSRSKGFTMPKKNYCDSMGGIFKVLQGKSLKILNTRSPPGIASFQTQPACQRSSTMTPFGAAARDLQVTISCARWAFDRTKSRCSTSPSSSPHLQTPQIPSEHLTSSFTPAS